MCLIGLQYSRRKSLIEEWEGGRRLDLRQLVKVRSLSKIQAPRETHWQGWRCHPNRARALQLLAFKNMARQSEIRIRQIMIQSKMFRLSIFHQESVDTSDMPMVACVSRNM